MGPLITNLKHHQEPFDAFQLQLSSLDTNSGQENNVTEHYCKAALHTRLRPVSIDLRVKKGHSNAMRSLYKLSFQPN